MARLLIVDGHIRPDRHVRVVGTDSGGREVMGETAFAPSKIHLAVDTKTGIVYAGRSEDEAVRGIGKTADDVDAVRAPVVPPIEYDHFASAPDTEYATDTADDTADDTTE